MEEHKKNTFRKVCSFLKDIWFPVLILGLVVFACLFGELIATHSPTQGPVSEYLILAAGLGRDIFSRLVTGARTTMMVGIAVVLVAGSIGTLVGVLAGYMGGAVDSLLMRLTDAVLSIPYTLIAMCLSVILGQSSGTVVFVLGITCWSNYAKVVRVETMSLKQQEFVTLAKLAGASRIRILCRHILPNLLNTIIVMATLQLGMAIILSSSLSFLGLGATPPTPEWGLMMSEGRDYMTSGAWWLTTIPGIALFLTVLSVNILGNVLRVKLDPKRMVAM